MEKEIFLLILMFSFTNSLKYIPYQAHGFNDLDYFTQLLVKGVNSFKMDLSPQIYDSCVDQSRWDSSLNKCEIFSSSFEICCLAFRGDTSSTPIFNQPFNHSMEFIDLLRDSKYRHILGKEAQYPYNSTINIAINFQYRDALAQLTQNFWYSLFKTIEDFDLDIEIITGSDNFLFAYMDKCNSPSGCSDVERYISQAPISLQTGSMDPPTRYGEQKFKNFNVFYHEIENYCKNGFPDWVLKYGHPLIFWEPSHEYQVKFTRDMWENTTCKNNDIKNVKNLRIASNLEPEMMQVYWKKSQFELKPGFNPDDQKAVIYGDYKNPSIEYSQLCKIFIMISNQNMKGTVEFFSETFDKVLESLTLSYFVDFARVQNDYLLIQGEAYADIYKLSGENQCSLSKVTTLPRRKGQIASLSANTNEIVLLYLNKEINKIELEFISLDQQDKIYKLDYELDPVLKTPVLHIGFDTYFSNITQTYHVAITFSKKGGLFGENIIYFPNQVKIYLSLLEINKNYQIIDRVAPIHHLDFGSTNELKLYEFEGKMYLLAIHTNGLCQSAILLNNNEWNKCIYENYAQYSSISNVEYMINYFWGELDEIKARVETGHKINGCDLNIMHAKVGNGREPSITLREKNGEFEAFVMAEFVHYKKQTAFTQLFCGSSNDYEDGQGQQDGLLLFSFDVVSPQQLNQV